MDVLKPIFCATSLIEIHVTGPYQYSLMWVQTMMQFCKLYQELNNTKGADMLNTERQIFTFVETAIFKNHFQEKVYYVALTLAYASTKKKL